MSTVDENIEVNISPSTVTPVKAVPANSGTALTESDYNTLESIFSSNDEDNHRIGQAILNRCDIQASIYWIWRLAKRHSHKMVYLRTKASRKFVEDTNLWHLSSRTGDEFSRYLLARGWLTTEHFQTLKDHIVEHLKHRTERRNFYDIQYVIKEQYRHLDPESKLTNLFETQADVED